MIRHLVVVCLQWRRVDDRAEVLGLAPGQVLAVSAGDVYVDPAESTRPRWLKADIFVSYREHVLAWETPVMLGPEVNTSFADSAPSFFENDDQGQPQLYFNSNRPGGMGSSDIYLTEMLAEGGFGPAVLVPELNSPQNDVTPEISRNGLEMFFQSDRPGGVGGADLWTSVRPSVMAPWAPPRNLGVVVNSESGDGGPSISSDGETLFFASPRLGGIGGFDLYMTTRTKHWRWSRDKFMCCTGADTGRVTPMSSPAPDKVPVQSDTQRDHGSTSCDAISYESDCAGPLNAATSKRIGLELRELLRLGRREEREAWQSAVSGSRSSSGTPACFQDWRTNTQTIYHRAR